MVVYGLSRWIATAVGSLVVLGAIDYVFRFRDRGIRVMLSGALLVAVGWACCRWLYGPAMARLGQLELARRVGRRFPELGDDLPGAVEFLSQAEDDPVAGSPALRRAVIAQTAARAERIDFASMLDPRPAMRGVLVAVGVCLVAGILLALDTLSCQIAMARLAYPLGEIHWPRKNYLELVERVTRVARGRAFEVEVIDRFGARLPPRVEIYYRTSGPGGEVVEEAQPMQHAGSMVVARRENVTRPFAYRVEGGDDRSMGWIDVELLDPPAVASLAATISPPEYTGRPASRSTGQLRLLRGSRVAIDATATKRLKSAAMAPEGGERVACQIGKDGRRFSLGGRGFTPEKSGHYHFDLLDREGIRGGGEDRWDIQILEDQPPVVSIERPSGTTFVTLGAIVPLRVTASDDLALRRINLVVGDDGENRPDAGPGATPGARVIALFEGPPRATPPADASPGQRQTIDYRWNLAEMRLRPGQRIVICASAEDYLPQAGRSDSRSIVVLRPEELVDRLAERQEAILAELARALNLQQESRGQLERVQNTLDGAGALDRAGVDRLRTAELGQREIIRILTDRDEGVPGQVERLLDDLDNNRLDSPDVQRRMESLLDELGRLGASVLPAITLEMTASIKTAEIGLEREGDASAGRRDRPLATSLAAARRAQDEVIAVLERLLGRLNRWNEHRRFHQRWAQLIRRQQSLAERTEALGRDLLGQRPEDLPPETAARLTAAAGDQLELARQLDQLLQEMDESREAVAARDPLAAETMSDAVARSRELGTGGHMLSAGDAIGRNRLARASALQGQIIAELREAFELLSRRRQDELARLAETLPAAEGELSELVRRQRTLRERMEQEASAAPTGNERRWEWESLGRQQGQLQADAGRLASRLDQLLAQQPAESLRAAAERMGEASRAAGAVKAHSAVRHAKEAEAALGEAAQRLAQHVARLQTEAATEELARLAAAIESLHRRQTNVADETRRLHVAAAPGQGQPSALRALAGHQAALAQETSELAATMRSARVFEQVLRQAAGQMTTAAGWLGRQTCDARAQSPQRAALAGLKQLLESLRPASSAPPAATPGGARDATAGRQAGKRTHPGAVAQLRLLKMLQEDLFVRTQKWEGRFGGRSPLPSEARREYKQLSQEQGRLADLLIELTQGVRDQESGDRDQLR